MTPPTILIVEDESIVALDLQDRLSLLGYQIIGCAASGDEAIKLAERNWPNLALMDIRLKGNMDGIETATELRARFNIPVVYLTAHADDATLERAKLTEPFGYLIKPFNERELHSTLDTALYKIKMEQRLQRQAVQLQTIVTAMPEGVALLDENRRILVANPRAREYLSILASTMIDDVVEGLDEYCFEKLVQREDTSKWQEIITAEPNKRIFEAQVVPVSVASLELSEEAASDFLLVIRDVTNERELQERVQLQDRLAALGQFSSGIAHDFNNIISSVIFNSQVVKMSDPKPSAKVDEKLDAIIRQARRASDLVKQILDFSRASDVQMEPFDLTPLVKEQLKMLGRMLPESITLEQSLSPDPCHIVGDPTRVLQVLMNLLLNARDALPMGGVLHVDTALLPGDELHLVDIQAHSEWVRVRVSDNGIGIDPVLLPHIFEPFFTTKGPDKGTGLGLAQVHGIVQQHGGYVVVDSEVGRGTTFSVYFPAAPVASDASVVNMTTDEKTDNAQGSQQTILVVEDNADARESLSDILELLNYRVLSAANGHKALQILETQQYKIDLLLSDLIMPEMGGVELLRELEQRGVKLRTVIMTGYASEDTFDELDAFQIAGQLPKPVSVERLSKCIEQVLQG